jgi:hypothetical protein
MGLSLYLKSPISCLVHFHERETRLEKCNSQFSILNSQFSINLKSIFQDMASTIPRPNASDRDNDAHSP